MDTKPTFTVRDKDSGERLTYRMDQESILIGRDQGNFIVLASKRVSRRHAEILCEDDNFFVLDLASGNGTFLNNRRLEPKKKTLLRQSDTIRIENFEISFHTNGSAQPDFGDITDPDILEVKMIKKLLRTIDKENAPVLEVVGGPCTGQRFALQGKTQEIVIGRDPSCEFRIDTEMVSRKHARIVKKWDAVTIIDLASKNGVYVNDARIREHVLSDGDRILLGTVPLLFRNPTEQSLDFLAAQPPPKQAVPPPEPVPEEAGPRMPLQAATPAPSGDTGPRVARRAGKEVEAAPMPAAEPEEASGPTSMPSEEEATQDEAPGTEGVIPEGFQIRPIEIALAAAGLLILIGSIWALMKLL